MSPADMGRAGGCRRRRPAPQRRLRRPRRRVRPRPKGALPGRPRRGMEGRGVPRGARPPRPRLQADFGGGRRRHKKVRLCDPFPISGRP